MVRISCGKVDPVTGDPVTPETIPVPGSGGGVRRSATHQPSRSGDRGRSAAPSAHSKSATMPTTTPSGTRSQQGQQQQRQQAGKNGWGGRRKQPQEWRGRAGHTHPSSRKHGGGGLLKDMFERARSRAEEGPKKENFPPNEPDAAVLQDVSEIVLACGSGQTPARCERDSCSRAPVTAAAVPNPFAKEPRSTAADPSPSDFRTPSALAGGGVRSTAGAAPFAGYAGGDSDAWSRLSKGCLTAGVRDGEDDSVREGGGAVPRGDLPVGVTPVNGDSKVESGASGTVSAVAESAGVKPVAPKRSLSAPSREGSTSRRGKKESKLGGGGRKSQSHPPPAGKGKGATMLSFFGRAAVSKP